VFTTHVPDLTLPAASTYDNHIVAELSSLLGASINRDLIFSSFGLHFTDYVKAVPLLHRHFLDNTRDLAGGLKVDLCAGIRAAQDATLLSSFPLLKTRFAALGCATAGTTSWLSSFVPASFCADPGDVIVLLRYLLRAEPLSLHPCYCGITDKGDGLFLEHILTCSRVRGAGRVYRHNNILVALDTFIRRMGLQTALEPTFYDYADGSAKRPDLVVYSGTPVCTDLTITIDPEKAVAEKLLKHGTAVEGRAHTFVPAAMSIYGELHASCDKFLRHAFNGQPKETRWLAVLQTKRAMSEAWLVGTAALLRSVTERQALPPTDDWLAV
jgi:hypothetical protein